ncbi:MAG: hypothetical protein OEV27_12120 [Nitrospira sp.]|nr:hypothetical protein [Nitrospira sp.]MDH4251924.1 hypothetical protein [Nitrospira sp.]MDH4344198.1 hypothetical protein [Nitrospira sp.]
MIPACGSTRSQQAGPRHAWLDEARAGRTGVFASPLQGGPEMGPETVASAEGVGEPDLP